MTYDIDAVRAQFPALATRDDGVRRIYLDNPAGTQVPLSVAEAMSRCLIETNANGGGYFRTSRASDAVVAGARTAMADFLNAASTDEIVFGQNMTTITLHVSRSIGRLMRPGDEIILSRMDHDANVWPWVLLARDLELEIRWLPFNTETFEFDADALDDVLTDRTRLLCIGGASNLLGTINDVAAMCAKARSVGAMTYIDAVQSVPHVPTDVQAIGCDFLVCSPYKFFGPHQGVLYGRTEIFEQLEPYRVRPAPSRFPGSFETGTQSIEGCAGITAAVDYLAWVGTSMGGAQVGPEEGDGSPICVREVTRRAPDNKPDVDRGRHGAGHHGLKCARQTRADGVIHARSRCVGNDCRGARGTQYLRLERPQLRRGSSACSGYL